MKKLDRLTEESLKQAEQGGKTAGWHALLLKGYLPDEISIHSQPQVVPHDVITRVRQYATSHSLPVPVSCAPKRPRRDSGEAICDWKQAFRQNVMRVGMNLSLTQPMLEFLCATSNDVFWDRNTASSCTAKPDCFLASSRSLEKRGLIARKSEAERTAIINNRSEPDVAVWRLTEAGHAVVLLLKSVGIFVEADASISKRSRA